MGSGFRRVEDLRSWRKIAVHTWRAPHDPTVYGVLEIDVTRALGYIDALRASEGVKVTLTHLVGKATALAIAERPEVNAVIRRGRHIYQRDTIDIFFQVAFEGGENLSGAKVTRADEKSVAEIARELIERIRARRDRDLQTTETMLDRIPTMLRGPALKATAYLTQDLGLDLRRFGLPYDQFGSAMVTNVGMFGLPQGFAPLVPFARTPILLTVGAVRDQPVAVDGRVEVRPVLTIGATFDHRLLDGYQAGKLASRFRAVMEDPAAEIR